MTSRERVIETINHRIPDRVPVDFCSTFATGINARVLCELRKSLGLEQKPIRLFDPYQMLGEAEIDFLQCVQSDTIGLWNTSTLFGTHNLQWKKCSLFEEDIWVGEDFNTTADTQGNIYAYPQGDISARPSAMMPKGGYYFDSIVRQEPVNEDALTPEKDFSDDYGLITEEELRIIEKKSIELYEGTNLALISVLTPGSFNDFAHLPAPFLKKTPGVRQVQDWLVFHYTHPDYIHTVHQMHLESALKNMQRYHDAVGERIQVMIMSGADYGTQNGLFMSREMFREFILPYHRKANEWVHKNTGWKTFYHTCGAVSEIIGDMAEAGADIINPVQYSAKDMALEDLKQRFEGKVIFWGGAIDVQTVLNQAKPEDVYEEVLKNLSIMHRGGGFVAGTTHNIQYGTPIENILAYMKALNRFNSCISGKKGLL